MPTPKPGAGAARICRSGKTRSPDGLVRFENGSSMQQSRLVLTPRGRAPLLERAVSKRYFRAAWVAECANTRQGPYLSKDIAFQIVASEALCCTERAARQNFSAGRER